MPPLAVPEEKTVPAVVDECMDTAGKARVARADELKFTEGAAHPVAAIEDGKLSKSGLTGVLETPVAHGVLLSLYDGHHLVCVVGHEPDVLETSRLEDGYSADELDEKTEPAGLETGALEIVLDKVDATSVSLQ